ncbi:MAG: hypothetical protein ACRCUK_13765 [Plesiomonas shigelloides]
MTKRESGWYRVFINSDRPQLMLYADGFWIDDGVYGLFEDEDVAEIDPQMVMTPSGQIVYNQPAHDPLYNTKQEG